jgi:hypothetical protein
MTVATPIRRAALASTTQPHKTGVVSRAHLPPAVAAAPQASRNTYLTATRTAAREETALRRFARHRAGATKRVPEGFRVPQLVAGELTPVPPYRAG